MLTVVICSLMLSQSPSVMPQLTRDQQEEAREDARRYERQQEIRKDEDDQRRIRLEEEDRQEKRLHPNVSN